MICQNMNIGISNIDSEASGKTKRLQMPGLCFSD